MSGHFSDEVLADYTGDALRPRRAARVTSHLAGCTTCQGRIAALKAVPSLLSGIPFPPIPDRLSTRIEMALASESSARLASEPATEAGRRDLPVRARPARRGWEMPSLRSPVAARAFAAAGAAVVVAIGGYAIVSHAGSSAPGTSSTGTIHGPASHAAVGAPQNGPSVTYRHSGHIDSIKTIKTRTDFTAATLGSQANAALAAQRTPTGMSAGTGIATPGPSNPSFGAPNSQAASTATLQGCVDRIATGRIVLLVDRAKYEGKPATIIVVAQSASRRVVYAVGSGCSASGSDILAQQSLSR